MAYTNETENLKLPQWVGTDKPKRIDYNTAFKIIDDFSQIDSIKNSVLYIEQTLTESQKEQVRNNIGLGAGAITESFNFSNSDLINNKLYLSHNRGTLNLFIAVYNDSNLQVIPTEIELSSDSQVVIDFSDITINNTWKVVIIG